MPYANLRIALRQAVLHTLEEQRQKKIDSAFIAWQQIVWKPLKKGKKHDDFARYCRKLGISLEQNSLRSEVVDAERDRAEELLKRAMGKKWGEVPQPRRGVL